MSISATLLPQQMPELLQLHAKIANPAVAQLIAQREDIFKEPDGVVLVVNSIEFQQTVQQNFQQSI